MSNNNYNKLTLFGFRHGLNAFGADRQSLAVNFFYLKINILPADIFNIGMGPGGVFCRTSSANIASFCHTCFLKLFFIFLIVSRFDLKGKTW